MSRVFSQQLVGVLPLGRDLGGIEVEPWTRFGLRLEIKQGNLPEKFSCVLVKPFWMIFQLFSYPYILFKIWRPTRHLASLKSRTSAAA